ncbi:MAG: FtsW/RodA/SpoVE family cell cycle protein [Eggerthellaceae bacterium]|nr:FtsW/RodA/SpoVE family cell cycle protein [Eggerthellaceae bacterium]
MAARESNSKRTTAAAPDILGPQMVLLLTVLALTLIGFVMIYSASAPSAITEDLGAASYLFDQLKFAAVGVVVAFVVWKFFPYHVWEGPLLWVAWGLAMALLLATAVMGIAANGAQRWLIIGSFSLQPSEFAKIALVMVAACWIDRLRRNQVVFTTFLVGMILMVAVPMGLMLVSQSDLGSTVIVAVGIIAVMWMGEVPLRAILFVIGGVVLIGLLAIFLASYRSDRFLFLNPWGDGDNGQGAGYQLVHSYYAISQGGLFGVGLGNSREKYEYLPESETDFIYSVICEELGLVGALVVMVLFLLLLWAGLRIARSAPDNFGCMLAGGLIIMLVAQAFLNIACAIGAFPTTGKPLPFISSGGSSLVASYIMIALVMSVAKGSGASSVYERRRDDLRVVRFDQSRR